jgi:hypothetical protein
MKRIIMLAALACLPGCYAGGGYYMQGPAAYVQPVPVVPRCAYITPVTPGQCSCYDSWNNYLGSVPC